MDRCGELDRTAPLFVVEVALGMLSVPEWPAEPVSSGYCFASRAFATVVSAVGREDPAGPAEQGPVLR